MKMQTKLTGRFVIVAAVWVATILAVGLTAAQEIPPAQPAPETAAPPPAPTATAPVPKIDTGDTAWLLTSSALVLAMTAPGLAIFYGGMVRSKNALNMILQSFIILCLISVQWVLWGYSLAFGPDKGHIIGGLEWLALNGVGLEPNPDYAATVPHQAFMIFQAMFAVITPALITGAFAERMKFSAFLLFILLWATFIYDPIAHWVWGVGGWLRNLGALDFAGGTVVHISSGVAGLACALILGRRHGYGHQPMRPHNLPLTVIGASMLWFGWFGFNAGSAVAAGMLATSAFVVTNTATATAALAWMFSEWVYQGKPTALGAASGAVAGLVAITPASGFVGPISSIWIGIGAGVFCYAAVVIKGRIGYDDALDVFAVHGIGGTWGALATGLFASKAINPAGADGVFFGNPAQLGIQAEAVLATWLFAFFGTCVLLTVVHVLVGLRVTEEEELTGLDLSQHNEAGYSFETPMMGAVGGVMSSVGAQSIPAPARSVPETRVAPARAPLLSSRRPPSQEEPTRYTLPSEASVVVREEPFDLAIQAEDPRAVRSVWERLCHDYPARTPKEFNELYPHVVTFSGDSLRFRKGDPERYRDEMERILALYGLEEARVEVTR
jgi:Amt family ammonium transporter